MWSMKGDGSTLRRVEVCNVMIHHCVCIADNNDPVWHQLSASTPLYHITSHQLSISSHHINSLSTGWGWSHRRCHSEVPVVTSHQVTLKRVVPSSKYAFSRVSNNRIDFSKGKSTTPEEPHRNNHPPTNQPSIIDTTTLEASKNW
jgi:hypothetical protein